MVALVTVDVLCFLTLSDLVDGFYRVERRLSHDPWVLLLGYDSRVVLFIPTILDLSDIHAESHQLYQLILYPQQKSR